MFEHLARAFGLRSRRRIPASGDPVLGTLAPEPGEQWWEARVTLGGRPVSFTVGGDDAPDAALLARARELALDFEAFEAFVMRFLADEAAQWAAEGDGCYTAEIGGLRIEAVNLWWLERTDDGMIYFEGGVEDRVWRCAYRARRPVGLGFDS